MTLPTLSAKHGFKCRGILHVGASMLEEAQLYHDMGVQKVIWVEAQPTSERRVERAKQYNQTLHEGVALSDADEMVTLRIASNEVSSSILPFKRHSEIYPDIVVTQEIQTQARRGDSFFTNGALDEIDTLVLDVQGAEMKVLKGLGKHLDQIQRAYVEVNLRELYEGCALKPEMDKFMADAGFVNSEEHPVHLEEWEEVFYWR